MILLHGIPFEKTSKKKSSGSCSEHLACIASEFSQEFPSKFSLDDPLETSPKNPLENLPYVSFKNQVTTKIHGEGISEEMPKGSYEAIF